MNTQEFVSAIKADVIDRTMDDYGKFYRDFDRGKATGDQVYGPAFELYDSLSEAKRTVYLAMLRQAMIDAVSGVFAVIDGVHKVKGQRKPLSLREGETELSGDLQDAFLAGVETDESKG